MVNAFYTWRNICATKLHLYVTFGYGEVSINTTNVVWDKVVTMQPNTTNYNNERVVDRLPLMTYGLKLSLEA